MTGKRRGIAHIGLLTAWTLIAALVFVAGSSLLSPDSAEARSAPPIGPPACVLDDGGTEGPGCLNDEASMVASGWISEGSSVSLSAFPSESPCPHAGYNMDGVIPCHDGTFNPSVGSCVYIPAGDASEIVPCPGGFNGLFTTTPDLGGSSMFEFSSDAGGTCAASFNYVYYWGGDARYPEQYWSARAQSVATCEMTYNGPRPDNLRGDTWVKVSRGLQICVGRWANVCGARETQYAESWVRVDGDLAPHAAFEVDNLGDGRYSFDNWSEPFATGVTTYEWDFGDGTTREGFNATHQYDELGSYLVRLTMRSSEGGVLDATRVVDVEPPELTVSVANPQAVFGPNGTGNRYSINQEFPVLVTLTASDGFGDLSNVTPSGSFLTLPPQLEVVEESPPSSPVTLTSGEVRTFSAVVAAVGAGRFTLRSTWAATDASDTTSEVTGEMLGGVTGLSVDIEFSRPSFKLNEDSNNDGEITPEDNDVEITVKLRNVDETNSISDLVVDPIETTSNALEQPAVDLVEQPPAPAAWPTSLAPGEEVTRVWTYRAGDSFDANIDVSAIGTVNGSTTAGAGDADLKVFTDKVLEARIQLAAQPYEAGKIVRVDGDFKNVTDETEDPVTISFGVVPRPSGNAGNGYFTTPGARTADGLKMFQLAPGEEVSLRSILQTIALEQPSEGAVEYEVFASKVVDGEWEAVPQLSVHVLDEDGFSPSQSVQFAPVTPEPEAAGFVSCSENLLLTFYLGCRLVAGIEIFLRSGLTLAKFVAGGLGTAVEAYWAILGTGLWAVGQTLQAIAGDEAARQRLTQEVLIDLQALADTGYVAFKGVELSVLSIGPAMDAMFREMETLFTTGSTQQILGAMTQKVGENIDMPLEALVAARALKKSMAAAAGNEGPVRTAMEQAIEKRTEKAIADVEDVISTEGARAVPESRVLPSGIDVTDHAVVWRDSYGMAKQELDKLLQISKDEGIVAAFRSRAPIAVELLKKKLAYVKPGSVPLKGVSDLDIKYLGYPASTNGKVFLLEPPVPYLPNNPAAQAAAIEDFLNTFPDLVGTSLYSRDMRNAVRSRLQTRLDEWPKNLKKFQQYQQTGIDVGFYQNKQGMHAALDDVPDLREARITRSELPAIAGDPSRPFLRRGYRLEMNGPNGFLDITGDIDFLAIFNPDGTVITDLVKRERIYNKLRSLLGMQHGESFTFNHKSRPAHLAGGVDAPGGETVLAATPDARLMTTYFNEGLSRLTNGTTGGPIAPTEAQMMFEATISESLSPTRAGGGLTLDDLTSLFSSGDAVDVAVPATPNTIDQLVNGLARNSVREQFTEDGRLVRATPEGDLEEYRAPGTGGSPERFSPSEFRPTEGIIEDLEQHLAELADAGYVEPNVVGRAGGRWSPVSLADVRDADGLLSMSPYTYVDEPSEPGDDAVSAASESLMSSAGGAWFDVGDRVVIDPGGVSEEFAVVASVSPLRFEEPLSYRHYVGQMIAEVAASSASIVPLVPARLLESRVGPSEVTVDGLFEGVGRVGAGSTTELTVVGRGGVPGDASAVMLNVTAVFPSAPGFLTVFPCGSDVPTASNVNYGPGVVVPNAVLAQVGDDGKVCVFSLAETDLIVDVNGYVPAGGSVGTLVPARLLESRVGPSEVTVDGLFEGVGRVGAGSTTELTVVGRGGVPGDASAVMLNVTAVFPSAPGFLTVFPCGSDVPTASNVNYGPGVVVPNAVLAQVGDDGKVCVFSLAETDLIVDVNGYVPAGGSVGTLVPARLLESRVGPSEVTVDGLFEGVGRVGAGSTTELTVVGRGGVPGDASAVMLNVTAVFPSAPGFLTVFPCGSDVPTASNVNYGPGVVVPNAVLAQVGDDGKVCVFSLAETDLIVDVNGYVP